MKSINQSRMIVSLVAILVMSSLGMGYWLGVRSDKKLAINSSELVKQERKLLYYRNPMGLSDTSPVPKKDSMGMDYIAVYEDEQSNDAGSAKDIQFNSDKVQKLGVRSEAVSRRVLEKTIHASGRIEPDERQVYVIAPRFEGYVERLLVNSIGQAVSKGQALFEVYSPELVSAQREYVLSNQSLQSLKDSGRQENSSMKQLANAGLARLKNWGISDGQIEALSKSGEVKRSLSFQSPVNGVVTEKKILQGMRFMPGDSLYQISDLSTVWVIADVFEQDIAQIKLGAKVKVKINSYPEKVFEGAVSYIYPTLNAETRTMPIRIDLKNPSGLLKPGMFAQVDMLSTSNGSVLVIPSSAVIDSGTRQIVLIQKKEGRYEPREISLGARTDSEVEVTKGLSEGDVVVTSANFLIDAESNLKAAVSGFGKASQSNASPTNSVVHQGVGKVEELDLKTGEVTINHGAIASLKWPAMTMNFKVANTGLLKDIKVGSSITFEFVERGKGEWVITTIKPAMNPPVSH
jgi:RND family efflux transporter MFP subunit